MFVAEILKFLFSFHVCFSTFYVIAKCLQNSNLKTQKGNILFRAFYLDSCYFLENLDSP